MRKKYLIIGLGLMVLGFASGGGAGAVGLANPADFGLHEGDLISAGDSSDPDVYIINGFGYKRLFLNPEIFTFYGHLGGFASVKAVTPQVRDAFITSGYFRDCESNDAKVYGVAVQGEDMAELRWIDVSGGVAVQSDPDFFKKVFCINNKEFNWYTKGLPFTKISDVPLYTRSGATVSVTPTPSVSSLTPGSSTQLSPSVTPTPAGSAGGGDGLNSTSNATPTPVSSETTTPTPTPGTDVVLISAYPKLVSSGSELIVNGTHFTVGRNVRQVAMVKLNDTSVPFAIIDGQTMFITAGVESGVYDVSVVTTAGQTLTIKSAVTVQ